MTKVLMKGNEAVGAAAIEAGCKYFFGYPITPQSEIPEYLSRELPKVDGCFLQAESEVAAINMLYGAAGAGARVMTSSSSPGVSLMQEGISYMAGAELPCVIVNMMRGGPGLGSIQPSQTDYFQSTRGGGNGDYRTITLAPSSVQELVNLIELGFDLADKYRNPVVIMSDGVLGQMMEPVEFGMQEKMDLPEKTWATRGKGKNHGERNIINSIYLSADELEEHNKHLIEKYRQVTENEIRVEVDGIEDADLVISAYGTTARIAKSAIEHLRKEGHKVGLIRPITCWPYPYEAFKGINPKCKDILVCEMNQGQMTDDVKIAVEGRQKVHFFGRQGGVIPNVEEIKEAALEVLGGLK
ncbi:3-methyl-2-oxobutanoate dehydrogenase subunit VorB [Peptoniphilus grossensis]|uniref:3-methyl-2-oxobutanoate dehydrogenase subunit VorB n=1 Tax=Peptoniphilus grossensis TaxID=1465756 RepID=UPI00288C1514|nr:3-methyl-2-oxobutanoate dehydrogenase subunit VorB [Peptoniphilus grossensis]